MPATVQNMTVTSEQVESTIQSFVAQGYAISNRTHDSVTMYKKKEFSVLWAVVGLIVCVLPLLVYLIIYATQNDQMVVIHIASTDPARPGGELIWSDDRSWWWDGRSWRDAEKDIPPMAIRSEDGQRWWDGQTWRPLLGSGLGMPGLPGTTAPRGDGSPD